MRPTSDHFYRHISFRSTPGSEEGNRALAAYEQPMTHFCSYISAAIAVHVLNYHRPSIPPRSKTLQKPALEQKGRSMGSVDGIPHKRTRPIQNAFQWRLRMQGN
jgi:hypothetical protein